MYILGNSWEDGFLDYCGAEDCVRIQVAAWGIVERIAGMYLESPRDWRILWNYGREIGFRNVLTKVISRSREKNRNKKVLAIGLGTVVDASGSGKGPSQRVAFIAPCHPPCVERVVLPKALTISVGADLFDKVCSKDGITFAENLSGAERFTSLVAWTPESGWPFPNDLPRMLNDAVETWRSVDRSQCRTLAISSASPIREIEPRKTGSASGSLRGVLYGLSNYAKVIIMPNLPPELKIECVHEIDPTQIGKTDTHSWSLDTSPLPRPDEKFDVYFIAGYHASHTPLAIHALKSGAWAVVEKPLVICREQLDAMTQVLRDYPNRLFTGFHIRYNPLWDYARKDLGTKPGDPINYYCIVYEVPLRPRHWYHWPNAKSKIVSNACHWLDHFLFMNDYCEIERYQLWRAKNDDVHINLELANGAVFSMQLTDQGSWRIGVQDHIELRANHVTVRVDRGSQYFAEDNRRVLRKLKINKMAAYGAMYRIIGQKILAGEPGDSMASIIGTNEIMLKLHDAFVNS